MHFRTPLELGLRLRLALSRVFLIVTVPLTLRGVGGGVYKSAIAPVLKLLPASVSTYMLISIKITSLHEGVI